MGVKLFLMNSCRAVHFNEVPPTSSHHSVFVVECFCLYCKPVWATILILAGFKQPSTNMYLFGTWYGQFDEQQHNTSSMQKKWEINNWICMALQYRAIWILFSDRLTALRLCKSNVAGTLQSTLGKDYLFRLSLHLFQ